MTVAFFLLLFQLTVADRRYSLLVPERMRGAASLAEILDFAGGSSIAPARQHFGTFLEELL
jgi:hypothetical protein